MWENLFDMIIWFVFIGLAFVLVYFGGRHQGKKQGGTGQQDDYVVGRKISLYPKTKTPMRTLRANRRQVQQNPQVQQQDQMNQVLLNKEREIAFLKQQMQQQQYEQTLNPNIENEKKQQEINQLLQQQQELQDKISKIQGQTKVQPTDNSTQNIQQPDYDTQVQEIDMILDSNPQKEQTKATKCKHCHRTFEADLSLKKIVCPYCMNSN